MSYRNEPKKQSNGVTERMFFFLAMFFIAVAFFGISKPVYASTNAENLNVIDMPADPADFGSWFQSQDLPLVVDGHEFWDYFVYSTPDPDVYNVKLFTASGVWIAGDSQSAMVSTSNTFSCGGTYCWGYDFDVSPNSTFLQNYNSGKNYYNAIPYNNAYFTHVQLGDWYSPDTGFTFQPSAVQYTSQNFYYISDCSITGQEPHTWYNSQGADNTAYNRCGSWDSNCSPVSSTLEGCGSVDPPPVDPPTTLSCSAVFDNIPGWTDPLGMFTGFFQALFSWFGCAFNGVFTSLHDNVVLIAGIVGDYFFNATDTIHTYFTDITTSVSGMFTGLTTSISTMFTDLTTSISDMLSSLFLPESGFLDDQIQTFTDFRDEKFPIFGQIQDVFSNGFDSVSGGSDTVPTMTVSLFGANNMQIMSKTVLSPYIAGFRAWVAMFLWFYCAIFCYRSIHAFFHPGQMKLNL